MLIRTMLLALGLLAAAAPRATAGGDGYDASEESEESGPVFFGIVRDARGLGVSEAEVMLRPRQGAPVTLKTNILGVYRAHVAKDTVAAEVEVSCSKAGYKQANVVRRGQPNARVTETNCTLQRL
jgi:hypothetical protein